MHSRRITIPVYEHFLVPPGVPIIWNIQEKGTAVEVRLKR